MRRFRFSIRGLMVVVAVVAVNAVLVIPLMKLLDWNTPWGRNPLVFFPSILGLNFWAYCSYLVFKEVWKMEGAMRLLWMSVLIFQGFMIVGFWALIQLVLTR